MGPGMHAATPAGLGLEGQDGPGLWEALPHSSTLSGPRRGLWAAGKWAAHVGGEHQGLSGALAVGGQSSPCPVRRLAGGGSRVPQGMGGAAWWYQAVVGISVYTCRAVSTWAPGCTGRWLWALGVLSSH